MSKIDWSKAPEWADGHGLVADHGITEVWTNMDQYAVVGAEDRAYPYGGGTGETRYNFTRDQVQYITPRPDRWNGEGLPPEGTVCEIKGCMSHYLQWNVVTVFAVRGKTVFFDMEDGRWGQTDSHEIRPLRTPEQIAADEREKSVGQMISDTHILAGTMGNRRLMAEQLYDAGYRKQVAP